MAMTYSSYVTTLQTMLVVQDATGQANLNAILPNIISYAELRCYRDLQLLNTVNSKTGNLTANSRSFTIPTPTGGTFVVIQSVQLVTPSSATITTGKLNPCQRVSKEYLMAVTPDVAQTDLPRLYANIDNTTLMFGPVPDAAYQAQVYGTYRPNPLSSTNTSTLLTTLFPDLFLSASMIFASGYQKDFGAQASDPQMAQSWENQYQIEFKGAAVEEFMKKAEAPGWQPFEPAPIATPPRQ